MSKITIIIPTHNRPSYLRRLLEYYREYGSNFDMIIADSSSRENKKLDKEIVQSFPNLNIQYIDKYPEKITALWKFSDIINYVETKYCVFCADDDFLVPGGVSQSVDFLEKNPDFTVAHGYYIDFWLEIKRKIEKRFCWGIRYTNQSIIFKDPKARLTEYMVKYFQDNMYAVRRTDSLKMIYKELLKSKMDLNPRLLGEVLISALPLIYGKTKCLDVLYMARELDRSRPALIDFTHKAKYDTEYVKLKQCLAVHYQKVSKLNIGESKKIIEEILSMYVQRLIAPKSKQVVRQAVIERIRFVLKCLRVPDWIYEKARLLHKKLFLSKQMNTFYGCLNDPSSKYYEDFNKIRSHIILFSTAVATND